MNNPTPNKSAPNNPSAQWLTVPAPAKLNLMLHITGQRADGYHELQTIFQFLEYGDQLSFQSRNDNELTLSPEIIGVNFEDNLIIKAARSLQNHPNASNKQCGANIRLEKILPMGGGLGGGSSDAATTMLALNFIWKLDLSLEELAELGIQLGADVPVFSHRRQSDRLALYAFGPVRGVGRGARFRRSLRCRCGAPRRWRRRLRPTGHW